MAEVSRRRGRSADVARLARGVEPVDESLLGGLRGCCGRRCSVVLALGLAHSLAGIDIGLACHGQRRLGRLEMSLALEQLVTLRSLEPVKRSSVFGLRLDVPGAG